MATGLLVAGLVMSTASQVYGAVQQGSAARTAAANSIASGEANRQIAQYNAKVAAQDAETAKKLAANRASAIADESALQIGSQKAMLAANGVSINEIGTSPLDLFMQTASDYQAEADYELWVGDSEYVQYMNQSLLYEMQGEQAAWAGYANAQSIIAQAPTVMGTALGIGASSLMMAGMYGAMGGAGSGMNAASSGYGYSGSSVNGSALSSGNWH